MKKMFRIQKDERQTGYLFGTMHTLNVDIERFSGLTEIISKTERLYTENCDLNILNKREFSYARQQFERLLAAQNKIIRASLKEREKVEEQSKKLFMAMKKSEIDQEDGEKVL